MKHLEKLTSTLQGFTGTIKRFPLTIVFFFSSAILTSYYITKEADDNYFELLFSFIFGAALFMVLQLCYERFIRSEKIRLIFATIAVIGAIIYYLILKFAVEEISTEIAVRTIVLLFILLILFIWIPSMKSRIGFSDSFMAVFKSFFTVAFYSAVMFLGIALILMAIDMLIADINSKAYRHVLNAIAFLYAPLHFLSLIPLYPAYNKDANDSVLNLEDNNEKQLIKAIEPSKFLEGLISYIIIPITVVFTFILLLYIVLNITGDFWKDNLMEPLLVSYSITVITVYLLACVIKSKIAIYFRMIFPKVLIPVVLFQTVSSVLKIGELGITAGRYYVIMFGIFSTVTAFIFSLRPNSKTNIVAPILIVLSLISVFPVTDAFTVSRNNQISRLTEVLQKNNMLKDGKIVPNANISQEDKQVIISSVKYLSRMNYTKDIDWLKAYSQSYDFEKTFGFSQYETDYRDPVVYRLYLPSGVFINVSGYDYIMEAEFYGKDNQVSYELADGENKEYILIHENDNDSLGNLLLTDSQKNELISFSLNEIFDRFTDRDEKVGEMSLDEARFIVESASASLCIVAKSVNYEVWDGGSYQNIEALIMIKIK